MSKETPGVRYAEVERETEEVRVRLVLDLDGERKMGAAVNTGIGYFDLMLNLLAYSGSFDLGVSAEGDLHVDDRHTVEEVGVCLGQAIRQALGDAEGITRMGAELAAVEDALAMVVVDLSGRPFVRFEAEMTCERIGGLVTENVAQFFRVLATHAGLTIHIQKMAGADNHHICESVFKGFGRALAKAVVKLDARIHPSRKD